MRALKELGESVARGGFWTKLVNPSVGRGKTAWPTAPADQVRIGVRFDYDGEVTINGVVHHKYQCQPNAGKIPSSIKTWRDANGGTHSVMTSIFIKKDGTKEEVQQAIDEALKSI
ncbi:conserved hypothetical protein [Histoplasma capsulatum var. duboisii H88]|uniref:Uncharacterized protein n=2 Tax=Ajellomyces capsulatus TaxID=5037 RepID=F0UUC8_AJEC8|nr:conserved hypothetical protein [Histoplasma capsulatum H143]EGC49505.1 conserved hypothetical protein [Histoplasma capsulatum var. duboisii H88]QSS57660.1 hypothetical protein I7I53_11923 [Histoplasma capsulatum var. duboisii H88]